jgi:hypothetical protein
MTGLDNHFIRTVEKRLLEFIARGESEFPVMLASVPGLYPGTLSECIDDLAARHLIGRTLRAKIGRSAARTPSETRRRRPHPLELPLPHPLDFEWRFSEATARMLSARATGHASSQRRVALLGVPSVFRAMVEEGRAKAVDFFDASELVVAAFRSTYPAARALRLDLSLGVALPGEYGTIACDPPWYPEDMLSFLRFASDHSHAGATLLMSLPPWGTRPRVTEEVEGVLSAAEAMGWSLQSYEASAIDYETPFFEWNSLRLRRLRNVPFHWRKGDLATFEKCGDSGDQPSWLPAADAPTDSWVEESVGACRLRLRAQRRGTFSDPRLQSIVAGDVLPSVSRREPLRRRADVWTSGNRVYRCEGPDILGLIVRAVGNNHDPRTAVASTIGRSLSRSEEQQVRATRRQVCALANREEAELGAYRRLYGPRPRIGHPGRTPGPTSARGKTISYSE